MQNQKLIFTHSRTIIMDVESLIYVSNRTNVYRHRTSQGPLFRIIKIEYY